MGDADAEGGDDGARLVHVDCEHCHSRLEVRVPLALQLAGRGATVRCGACDTLLQVAIPAPPAGAQIQAPPSPSPFMTTSSGDGDGGVSLSDHWQPTSSALHQQLFNDGDSGGGGGGGGGGGDRGGESGGGSLGGTSQQEQQRHLQLARYHMDMAHQHSTLNRHSTVHLEPPLTSLGGLQHVNGTHATLGVGLGPTATGQHQSHGHLNQLWREARNVAAHANPNAAAIAPPQDFWNTFNAIAVNGGGRGMGGGSGGGSRPAKAAKRECKPREPSPYNVFIREEIPRLKEEHPELNHKEAFKAAAKNWAHSPINTRSAAYIPGSTNRGGSGSGDRGGEDSASRLARAAIMQKLQPHLLKGRADDEAAAVAAAAEAAAATMAEEAETGLTVEGVEEDTTMVVATVVDEAAADGAPGVCHVEAAPAFGDANMRKARDVEAGDSATAAAVAAAAAGAVALAAESDGYPTPSSACTLPLLLTCTSDEASLDQQQQQQQPTPESDPEPTSSPTARDNNIASLLPQQPEQPMGWGRNTDHVVAYTPEPASARDFPRGNTEPAEREEVELKGVGGGTASHPSSDMSSEIQV